MAIRWLEDIGIIKRVLAEAETSARLVAIRSLEMMLNSDALKVLEDAHANAISFEKFFIEKAIQNIKNFQETGETPQEIQKALEKQKRLSKDSVGFSSFAVENDYGQEPVEIGDLSSALSSYNADYSKTDLPNSNSTDFEENQLETSSQSAGMIDSSSTLNSEADMDVVNELEKDIQNLSSNSQVGQNSPEDNLNFDNNDPGIIKSEDSGLMSDTHVYSDITEAENVVNHETEIVDDLMPLNAQYDSKPDYKDSESYDDLLPSLNSSQSDVVESYDDLLPPLNSNGSDGDESDSFDSLLPPLGSIDSDVIDNFDDLLPSSVSEGALNPEDDYKDLLPSEASDVLLDNNVTGIGQSADYDDLLPPVEAVEGFESTDYDDLLPPLDVNSTEYDDLLPPMASNLNTEDLLPPLKMDTDNEEGSTMNYDDLLPPLK